MRKIFGTFDSSLLKFLSVRSGVIEFLPIDVLLGRLFVCTGIFSGTGNSDRSNGFLL
jgi:hypothetical protein